MKKLFLTLAITILTLTSFTPKQGYPCHPAGDLYPCVHPIHALGDLGPCCHTYFDAYGNLRYMHFNGDLYPCVHPMHYLGDLGPCMHVCF